MPRVSVVTAGFNAEDFVETAVNSVLKQTEPDLEFVFVDDASTDRTAERVEELAKQDPRIRLVRLDVNQGWPHARNTAMAEARGDWIAVLDADDWYDPRRLEVLLSLGDEHNANIVADNQYFVSGAAASSRSLMIETDGSPFRVLHIEDVIRGDMYGQHNNLGFLKPVVRRDFISRNRLRYEEKLKTGADFDFLIKCLANDPKIVLSHEPLYLYRLLPDSVCATRTIDDLARIKRNNDDLELLFSTDEAARIRALLHSRGHSIDRYIEYRRITESLKKGRLIRAMSRSLSNRRYWPQFVGFLSDSVRRRIGFDKTR